MADLLKAHLNVSWLRPESALWDAIASEAVARLPIKGPALDLGCGNGISSFITAGGAFDLDYDWFVNSDPRGFTKDKDLYDVRPTVDPRRHVSHPPRYQFDWGFDHKANLLAQASRLGLYRGVRQGDADKILPFADRSLRTVFSNILYWLQDPVSRFKELHRVLETSGQAIVCLQDPSFKVVCESYQWKKRRSPLLKMLNRGRADCSYWTITLPGLRSLARKTGFKLVHHETYLSPATLRFWDIGLRPLSPALLEMERRLAKADRRKVKSEWIKALFPILSELRELDRRSKAPGGYHLAVLQK